jgi:hypothetical protein
MTELSSQIVALGLIPVQVVMRHPSLFSFPRRLSTEEAYKGRKEAKMNLPFFPSSVE